MIEVKLLIPLADNEGQLFSDEHHRVFEGLLLGLFGGFSRLMGQAAGAWRDEKTDKVYTDYSVVYIIALPSIIKADAFGEVAAFAKSHYRQEAIYLSYLGLSEVL